MSFKNLFKSGEHSRNLNHYASLVRLATADQELKEEEEGKLRVNQERTKDVLESKASIVAVGCPFCMTMMNDGVKKQGEEQNVQVKDIAEIVADSLN